MSERAVENLEGKIRTYMEYLGNIIASHLQDHITPSVVTQSFSQDFSLSKYISSRPKTLSIKLSEVSASLNEDATRVIFSDEQKTQAMKEIILTKLALVDGYQVWGGKVIIQIDLREVNPQIIEI